MIVFSWDAWNLRHLEKHGVKPVEAEHIVRNSKPPFPREIGEDKQLVWGQTELGRYLQVIFVFRSDDEVEYESLSLEEVLALSENRATVAYVIHAMELSPKMKRQYRRL